MLGIFVFSATGNTMKCASFLKEVLSDAGHEVELKRIENGNEQLDKKYDTLFICYPIHGFNMPTNVYNFCKNLKNGEGTNVYFIESSGEPLEINHASSKKAEKALKKNGFNCLGDYHYIMPYNMIFKHTNEMAAKMWDAAQRRITTDALDMASGKPHHLKRTAWTKFVCFVVRIEHWGMRLSGRFFHVRKKKCIKCMACVKNCPMNNITYDEKKDKFRFGGKCLGCNRCAFQCPKDAIFFGLMDWMSVNGQYNFNTDKDKAVIGRYCHNAYVKYFRETDEKYPN